MNDAGGPQGLTIAIRKHRLDHAADASARERIAWFGDTGDACPRCHIAVPENFRLALPATDIEGCLRCLEWQGHVFLSGIDALPADLISTGGQTDALREIAHEFRQHVRAGEKGQPLMPKQSIPSRSFADAQAGREADCAWPSPWPAQRRMRPPRRKMATPPPPPSPADILGLSGAPTRAEIVAAFRRSALFCHPDHGGSEAEFLALVAARDALLAEC